MKTKFILVVSVVMCLFGTVIRCSKHMSKKKRGYNHSDPAFDQGNFFDYQSHQSFYNDPFPTFQNHRRFAIPGGTTITLSPSIQLPILSETNDSFGFSTNLHASVPMSFTFRDASMGFLGEGLFNGFRKKTWGEVTQPSKRRNFDESFLANEQNRNVPLSRKLRDLHNYYNASTNNGNIDVAESEKCLHQNLLDRKMVLQKLEMLVSGLGVSNSKACLLRAACEIHETPMTTGFGLVGEIITTLFSIQELSDGCKTILQEPDAYLAAFIKSEKAGKSGKCHTYEKQCSKSLFTS